MSDESKPIARGLDFDDDVTLDRDVDDGDQAQLLLPQSYLSVSQISLYHSCARRYYYRYIERCKTKRGSNMLMGGFVHSVVEHLILKYMRDAYKLPPREYAQDFISDKLPDTLGDIDYWEGNLQDKEDPIKGFEKEARELSELFRAQRLPQLRPRRCELKVRGSLGGMVPFVGYIDIVDRDMEKEKAFGIPDDATEVQPTDIIRDVKVVSRKWHKTRVENSLQLSLYALVTGTTQVGYDLLIRHQKKAGPRVCAVPDTDGNEGVATRTRGQLRWAEQVAIDAAKGIVDGHFPRCDPEAWVCNTKWCDYYFKCRGKYEAMVSMASYIGDE